MPTSYAQKQSPAQKKDAPAAASVLDSSSQGESLQRKADMANNAAQRAEAPRPNNTGMPDNLKSGIESLSGFSMDDVRVHYNSSKPATVQALAYTQGTDIHVAPGQEKHLPHEAWHVAQQMAGRVSPTTNINGMPVNDNAALEHEADVMGEKAVTQRKENKKKEIITKQKETNCLQKKNAAVVVEMISPIKEKDKVCTELKAKRANFKEKFNQILKSVSRENVVQDDNYELLFAIDFNEKNDDPFNKMYVEYKKQFEEFIMRKKEDEIKSFFFDDERAAMFIESFKNKKKKKKHNSKETELKKHNLNAGSDDDGYISYGTSCWEFGASIERCDKTLKYEWGISELPYRAHMPFGAWRKLAHEVAINHQKANSFKDNHYDMIYKTADSDNAWSVDELIKGMDNALAEGEPKQSIFELLENTKNDCANGGFSAKTETVLDTSSSDKKMIENESFNPLVVTTPYKWTKGNIDDPVVGKNQNYLYNNFLSELNDLEIKKRWRLYKKHPLKIYYPEPTTYFNSDAAKCADNRKSGVLEGAAKITAIVEKLLETKKIKGYDDVEALEKYFKFEADSPLSSDPGNRAKQLINIYDKVKDLDSSKRKKEIIENMKSGLDQSAYEENYEVNVYKWNTTKK